MKYYKLRKSKRVILIYLITILGFMALVVKLSYVKIVNGQNYYELALDLWTREAPVSGARGNIYDRNGNLIVGTYLAPTLITIPKQVEDKDKTAKTLSNILKVDEKAILKHLNKNVSVEIIKPEGRYISTEAATKIIKANLKGIYVVSDSKRSYPYGEVLSQIIGIVGGDNVSLTAEYYQTKVGTDINVSVSLVGWHPAG